MGNKKIQLAAYVYAAWHPSAYRKVLGHSWTEWELIKSAKLLFPGHKVIEKPLWGYYDDSKPSFVQKQIRIALNYNIDIFIFNYYWDDKPILNNGIDNGFLNANNNQNIKFCLQWSPRRPRLNLPLPIYIRDDLERPKRAIKITPHRLFKFINFCAKRYFYRKNYLKVDNKPVLYFFQYYNFLDSLGEVSMRIAFKKIDNFLQKKGYNGLFPVAVSDYIQEIKDLTHSGFKAITSYNLLADYYTGKSVQNYTKMLFRKQKEWIVFHKKSGLSYFPSVSLGFDASCRGEWKLKEPKKLDGTRYYPWYPIITKFNINSFKKCLSNAFEWVTVNNITPAIISISSWNEWSEGNCLEPGKESKFTYLQAVKEVYESKIRVSARHKEVQRH